MKTTNPKKTTRNNDRLIGRREILETIIAATIFGSIVAVVLLPVTNAVGPWVA